MNTKRLCGWASQSEKKSVNGRKGDQTGKEVRLGYYYNFRQSEIIRFKSKARGKKAARAMIAMCKNDNIGYGQSDRTTLYTQCRAIGWNLKKISQIRKCNCDCSEICACAINFAYGKEIVPSYATTRSLKGLTVASHPKKFKTVSVNGKTQLGDMPLTNGKHVIMIVE